VMAELAARTPRASVLSRSRTKTALGVAVSDHPIGLILCVHIPSRAFGFLWVLSKDYL
jgi:hypothetical protein